MDYLILWPGLSHFSEMQLHPLSLSAAHLSNGIIASLSFSPSSDRWYSTRGGISENDSLINNCCSHNIFKVSERVFGLIPRKSFRMSLNLSLPRFPIVFIINNDHFLLIMSITPSSGQKQRCSHLLCCLCLWFNIVTIIL